MATKTSCIFCEIAHRKDPKTELLYEDETVVVFNDKRPASKHHYLVIPKEHIEDASKLEIQHISLVEKLVQAGVEVLTQRGGTVEESRIGFHWPPACSVYHLHLHVIYPINGIKKFYRVFGKYSERRWWFKTPTWLTEHLKKTEEKKQKRLQNQKEHISKR